MCLFFLSLSVSLSLTLTLPVHISSGVNSSPFPVNTRPRAVLALAREPSLVRPRSPATPDGSYLNRSSSLVFLITRSFPQFQHFHEKIVWFPVIAVLLKCLQKLQEVCAIVNTWK